uniref:Uncharacterized protein n=1 Tax=uncultured Thiotrichaceae bacterium TaxID=298394 RepID=A0A6S6SY68_9GAMM|nr:MAG: Unknown protein [uncultured Thiotrichaceae bacterium]
MWVNDSTGNKIKTWYTASQAGCSSGAGACTVTPSTTLAQGAGQGWIQTWNNSGYGPWSSASNFTVGSGGAPVAATLTSPSGNISDTTPTYTWNAVADSTWYYLWVNDSTGNKIKTWYTAAQAGCSSGSGTCTVTPSTMLAQGAGQGWIQTWNNSGYGPWSSASNFTVGSGGAPVTAILTSPSGNISDTTPTYTWNAVSDSTWYYLWVNDSTGDKIKTWYTAAQAGCSSGSGTCTVTPSTPLAQGAGQWWIQTWNSSGSGPWSSASSFTVGGNQTSYTCPSTFATDSGFNDSYVTSSHVDISWPSQFTYGAMTVAQIAESFNAARAADSTVTGNLVMPPQAIWDAYSSSEKALFLVNSERCARGLRIYEGIAPEIITAPAQPYAQLLATAAGGGLSHNADGRTPWERLAQDAGVTVNSNADFFMFAENLAYQSVGASGGFPTVFEPVAKSVYAWLYKDKGSSYGHRNFLFAKQLVENSGKTEGEGLIGVGVSSKNFQENGFFWTRTYTVLNAFDPNASWKNNLSNIITVEIFSAQ